MKNILVLTNLYPAPDMEKENTPVVHYFMREWVQMGYNVRVINFPANFPKIVMWGASLFKKRLSSKFGTTIRTFQVKELEYILDQVRIKRIPLLKYKLHASFPKSQIDKAFLKTIEYLRKEDFFPDMIISHWVNPQLEIMDKLKSVYHCKTCYVAHTASMELDRIYTKEYSQHLIDNIDLIGFRSVFIRDTFIERFKYDRPSFLCYSGVPDKFIPAKLVERTFANISKFVFVGTLIKRKYPAEIIPALVKAFGQEKFDVSYIGNGSEARQIAKYAEDLCVKDNVHKLGYISRDEVVNQLRDSDVFIMISKREAYGLVYLEAMAQGLITIASREEGFDGIIEHGKNGFLCQAGNIEELANLISEIKQMPSEKLKFISHNAYLTAKKLTDQKAAKMYIDTILKYL